MAGVGRQTAYRTRDADESFKERWSEHVEAFADQLEQEAKRRAHDGWDEPVFYQGQQVGVVRKYSDRMLELMLKATRPAKYRESLADALAGRSAREVATAIRSAMRAAVETVPGPGAKDPNRTETGRS